MPSVQVLVGVLEHVGLLRGTQAIFRKVAVPVIEKWDVSQGSKPGTTLTFEHLLEHPRRDEEKGERKRK